ncbi:uncharacterized protein LOC117642331 [Thrips palmi]|uniref:Uncharacterized protein LOC117642331 n=1 Tax=Thrips palmi TaxID=161013 RepID=A0A6P8Y9H4_THRPL|nr:uncharacterized protein LOC117642331 [Thrips palmi]
MDLPFAVVKFPPGEDEDTYFEVCLTSWIVGSLNDDMEGETYWPPDTASVSNLIKMQHKPDTNWKKFRIIVMRFYETYAQARSAVSKFVVDSNYETDQEATRGRGKRVRYRPLFLVSSDSEEEVVVRKRVKSIPSPPPVANKAAKPRNSAQGGKKVVKGRPESAKDVKRKEALELMQRIRAAKEAPAAKMGSNSSSKLNSPWKVTDTPQKNESPKDLSALDSPDPLDVVEVQMGTPTSVSPKTPVVTPSSNNVTPAETELTRLKSFYYTPPHKKWEEADKATTSSDPSCRVLFESEDNEVSVLSDKSASTGQHSKAVATTSASGRQPSKAVTGNTTRPTASVSKGAKNSGNSVSKAEVLQARNAVTLSEISSKLDIVMMNLARISRQIAPGDKRMMTIPKNMPKIPLETVEDLKRFEDFLKQKDLHLATAVDYMGNCIRSNVPDPERKSAAAVLTKLMTNSLASKFNLDGRGRGTSNKMSFRKLHLYKVFQGTLQTAFPDSDLSIADDSLQKWLKDAKWRKPTPASGA